jgi:ribosomal protein S18 acetylase RimI-like enzyme
MSTVTVRQAVLSDIPELTVLFDQYREFQGRASDLPAARAFLQARFQHGESVVFIARQGQVAVGFAQLYPSYSSVSLARVLILNDLYVQESARRQGAASRLLAAVEGYAASLGAVRITLNVARNNEQGQALYEARGWSRDEQFYMYHRFPTSDGAASDFHGRLDMEHSSDAVGASLDHRVPTPWPATFTLGERVRKKSGSAWQGQIVGWYSTQLTPEGYAVESEAHLGSVQIYPVAALERVA